MAISTCIDDDDNHSKHSHHHNRVNTDKFQRKETIPKCFVLDFPAFIYSYLITNQCAVEASQCLYCPNTQHLFNTVTCSLNQSSRGQSAYHSPQLVQQNNVTVYDINNCANKGQKHRNPGPRSQQMPQFDPE